GIDRDLLERARGGQPVLLDPVTCPKCLYSASSDVFDEPVDEGTKKWILSKPLLVPQHRPGLRGPTEGMEPEGARFPAWVRHDLIAQIRRHQGAGPDELSYRLCEVAWSVRFEENPFQEGFTSDEADAAVVASGVAVPDPAGRDDVAFDLAVARALLPKLPGLPPAQRRPAAMLAGFLLRTHGEHPELLEALPTLALGSELEAAVRTSIELERGYQARALTEIEKLLPSLPADSENLPVLTYLAGELHRRLGRPEPARDYFRKAAALPNAQDWVKAWSAEQEKLTQLPSLPR
ncbi:MAG: hypothetical protein AB1758_02735, partial [Candidatus Eremiobacterota bacterium]